MAGRPLPSCGESSPLVCPMPRERCWPVPCSRRQSNWRAPGERVPCCAHRGGSCSSGLGRCLCGWGGRSNQTSPRMSGGRTEQRRGPARGWASGMWLRVGAGLDGAALVHGGVAVGGVLRGRVRSKALPGSTRRCQMRLISSGRKRRTVAGLPCRWVTEKKSSSPGVRRRARRDIAHEADGADGADGLHHRFLGADGFDD